MESLHLFWKNLNMSEWFIVILSYVKNVRSMSDNQSNKKCKFLLMATPMQELFD